ncbi:hypothetical protein RJT34_03679 [Clitoria ternatea]|uniref:Uncharacterized protein n=1 Tax=Clitoria ternatea TaxID=43366 RepID=A0AAN9KJF9_CLITE
MCCWCRLSLRGPNLFGVVAVGIQQVDEIYRTLKQRLQLSIHILCETLISTLSLSPNSHSHSKEPFPIHS